jgi:hypothetical protein
MSVEILLHVTQNEVLASFDPHPGTSKGSFGTHVILISFLLTNFVFCTRSLKMPVSPPPGSYPQAAVNISPGIASHTALSHEIHPRSSMRSLLSHTWL